MNRKEEDIFLKDIEVPRVVQRKAEEAFLKIAMEEKGNMEKKKGTNAKKNDRMKKFIKPFIAMAACAALAVTVSVGRNAGSEKPDLQKTVGKDEMNLQKGENLHISFPDFSITAYAAGLNIAETDEGNIIFADAGIGENGYTGIMFNIQGNEISDVDISIDKGELYSAKIEHTTEKALHDWMAQGMPDMDGNPDTYTIVETFGLEQREEEPDMQNVKMYHCTKRGMDIMEKYDSEVYYGFYIPDNITSKIDDEADLAAAYHDAMHIFDDAVLTVTVTYSDGSDLIKEYELSATKLSQDENGTILQEEWKGGEEGAFVYGIIAREKK